MPSKSGVTTTWHPSRDLQSERHQYASLSGLPLLSCIWSRAQSSKFRQEQKQPLETAAKRCPTSNSWCDKDGDFTLDPIFMVSTSAVRLRVPWRSIVRRAQPPATAVQSLELLPNANLHHQECHLDTRSTQRTKAHHQTLPLHEAAD